MRFFKNARADCGPTIAGFCCVSVCRQTDCVTEMFAFSSDLQFFVNARADCGLTIAGFYYVSVCRQTGCITGYYWDPQSTPFQLLHLTPAAGSSGASFGSYEFH
eukprot:1143164-Pelagomonas_calceolata.AAC.3